jgi:hypothetical protein
MIGPFTRRRRKRIIWINQFSDDRLVSLCDKYRESKKQNLIIIASYHTMS